MDVGKRLELFVVGVLIGLSMFFIGGVAVVPAHSTLEPTAVLTPWLQRTMCNYTVVVCTSHGAVVTSSQAAMAH